MSSSHEPEVSRSSFAPDFLGVMTRTGARTMSDDGVCGRSESRLVRKVRRLGTDFETRRSVLPMEMRERRAAATVSSSSGTSSSCESDGDWAAENGHPSFSGDLGNMVVLSWK